jgi:hypothetical protein
VSTLSDSLNCPNCGHAVPVNVPDGTLGQVISTFEPGDAPSDVASAILTNMLPDVPAAFLHSAVAGAVRLRQRRAGRDKERSLLRVERDWDRDVAARKAMLQLPLLLGDGSRVTWGTATWDQWAQRDQMLDGLEVAIVEGIKRGRAVAQWALACRSLNPEASCLNEVTVMPPPPRIEDDEPAAIEGTATEETVVEEPVTVPKAPRTRRPRKLR